jgi:hypothetical protein
MSYYNLCGIRSQHSNISKGKKGGVLIKKIRVMQDYNSHDRQKQIFDIEQTLNQMATME